MMHAHVSLARRAGVQRQVYGYLLLLPALAPLALFTHYPALAALRDSLLSSDPGGGITLEHYRALWQDDTFVLSLYNNLRYALLTIPLAVGLALAMALAVNRRARGSALIRTAFFLPSLLPMVAIANLWLFFYTPQLGLLNRALALLGCAPVNWLGDPDSALYCLMAVSVWREAGFFMIFYLAALQQIDPRLSEAAAIEGASRLTFFRRVQWPLLMPTTLFVLINASMNAFRLADQVIAMTNGGPDNSTSLLLFYIYRTAFSYWDLPYAAAMTVVLLAILAALTLMKFTLLDRRAWYQ
ncbi:MULTISPECIES: carbohydrate ABC transporter permease [Edwardsiella]|uniref:Inner membrane component of binding-protein-dependent transport system n=2 Tax=Edwardsiella anguillarum TaxID=1821960 RepID=A0A076LRQ1_9GAMM|nr:MULTISPECIES: sugar ABC transporter permease [Edwardsiella]GAJ67798.1 inner membrane component of binding-protein-dependent transport system [Edwardsiella piscicida]AIJ09228.1 inner membrane component of binding-protein-dependent transport system [Edwardsiella anguillarum ET080813]AKR79322.2 sugar ABC transporter permease [Edwardsiella sp. LADL05-105]KAB0589935.1 sugar ABC transporter permease [Edwardsiella anguillarum]RFS99672.1 sugar ABC transporter permease [Edwardsiella anguillarum]